MEITGHTIEKLEDPFDLLSGDRYELFLDLNIDEDDELYSEKGIGLKVIFVKEENDARMAYYHFFEKETEKVFDFELEDDEEELVFSYCKQHTLD